MEIETSIEGFKLYSSCKGLSPKTITWYDAFLRHLADFLRHHHHPTEISQLSVSHLRAWLHHGQERGLSPYTVQGQARTGLCDLACQRGASSTRGSGGVDGVRGDHLIVAPLYVVTEAQIETIIDALR